MSGSSLALATTTGDTGETKTEGLTGRGGGTPLLMRGGTGHPQGASRRCLEGKHTHVHTKSAGFMTLTSEIRSQYSVSPPPHRT